MLRYIIKTIEVTIIMIHEILYIHISKIQCNSNIFNWYQKNYEFATTSKIIYVYIYISYMTMNYILIIINNNKICYVCIKNFKNNKSNVLRSK